jgi:hypothetical protein
MVLQNLMLLPAVSILERVSLALQDLPFILPLPALKREIRAFSLRDRFSIDPWERVRDPSIGERQLSLIPSSAPDRPRSSQPVPPRRTEMTPRLGRRFGERSAMTNVTRP